VSQAAEPGQEVERAAHVIEIKDLEVDFGPQKVLRGINLKVEAGEIIAIMGSSGGGKTTLLRSISGLQSPTRGSVVVDGIEVHEHPELARSRMGMVFQSAALFDFMSVQENVEFGLERLRPRPSREEIRARALKALADVGLEGVGAKAPDELSGGMRKRVGIARARVLSPLLMLYDEPTTGLDPTTTYAIDELIATVGRSDKLTSVLVSHDVNSVLRTADRVAFLHAGELVFQGTPQEFLVAQHPAVVDVISKSRATSFLPS
jgi:phospholipid/cholesterol/gamma-HCH transport system ATP-binding protein